MSRSKSNKEKLSIYISLFNLLAGVISLGMLGIWNWWWLYWGVFKSGVNVGEVVFAGDFRQSLFFILPALALAAVVFLNFYSVYSLIKNNQLSGKILGFSLAGWAVSTSIFVVVGLFFISPPPGVVAGVPILALLLTAVLVIIAWKFSWKLASLTLLLVALAVVYSLATHFEEQYCWAKGDEAQALAQSRGEPIWDWPTEEEKARDLGIENIGVGYRAHMNCHRDFSLFSALKDELIP